MCYLCVASECARCFLWVVRSCACSAQDAACVSQPALLVSAIGTDAAEWSYGRLGRSYLDLYQLHFPFPYIGGNQVQKKALSAYARPMLCPLSASGYSTFFAIESVVVSGVLCDRICGCIWDVRY